MMLNKQSRRRNIRYRIRKKVKGTSSCPRLSVFRSNKQIYAQLIDDVNGVTLVTSSTRDKSMLDMKAPKVDLAREVGKSLASNATQNGISSIVFDRGGYLYHGRVKALAEGAREGGLQF
ncbi:MAG: 50S ribosomal protein L18 [Bacteroidota bacterium]